jgi:hypothetical protein
MNEELKKPAEENLERNPRSMFDKFNDAYRKLSPETQVVFGSLVSYIYLVILLTPDLVPEIFEPAIELLDKMPMRNISLWITTMIAMTGSIDGVRRIITERLPFYKAFVHVFLLHKFDDEDSSQ